MNRDQVRRDALKYVLFATLGTTAVFGAFVYGARPGAPEAPAKNVAPTSVKAVDAATRPFVLTIPCWDKIEKVELPPPGTRWLRITGKVCGHANVDLDAVAITNETNHYAATIFPSGGALTTDLIGLTPGTNDLQISIAGDNGRVVKHLALTR